MRRARLIALCIASTLLAGACSSGGAAGRGDVDDSALSAAAGLRVKVERLIREHVFLAAFISEAALTRQAKPLEGAQATFDDGGVEFAKELRDQYGESAERTFLAQWRKYQTALTGYAVRLPATRSTPAKTTITRNLAAFGGQFGSFMASITPLLNPRRAGKTMQETVTAIQAFMAAQAKKDFVKADALVRTAASKATAPAALIAFAMIEDHPAQFTGDPDAASAKFRFPLSAGLSEGVYLLALATEDSLTKRSAGSAAARAALKTSIERLAAHLGVVYGDAFVKAFTPLWTRQADLLVSYAGAGKDKAKADKAVADMRQHSKDIATFVAGANGSLDKAEVEQLLSGFLDRLIAVVTAQVKGDFDAAGAAIRSAAQATDRLSAVLAFATALKFPAKFPAPAR